MTMLLLTFILVVAYLHVAFSFRPSHLTRSGITSSRRMLLPWGRSATSSCPALSTALRAGGEPVGGAVVSYPHVKNLDKEKNVATILVSLSGDSTQRAFTKACELFNEEVKNRNLKVPGFRAGAKLPAQYLYNIFGEEQVKGFCSTLLAKDIQTQCDATGILTVGRGKITNFDAENFTAGKQHVLEVEVELWPTITYSTATGTYAGLQVKVPMVNFDVEKFEKVKTSVLERYKELAETPAGYAAQLGDIVVGDMQGYEKAQDGGKGTPLPAIAKGEAQEIALEKGKYMDGMIDGLVGATAGDVKLISVKFPVRPSGPGAKLSGKEAIFEIKVASVKSKVLPKWDQALADKIRPGMTIEELEKEVREAVDSENSKSSESIRNDAIAAALAEVVQIDKVPESLVEENTQMRYQNMLMDFKEQGSDETQLREMATEENYNKYKEISRPNVEKVVKLGLMFREIAEKENISVSEAEIQEQLDLINAQARQKGGDLPDADRAREEIENTLLRLKVFDCLAKLSKLEYFVAEKDDAKAK